MFKRKGGGQRPFEQCSKKLHFSLVMASLIVGLRTQKIDPISNNAWELSFLLQHIIWSKNEKGNNRGKGWKFWGDGNYKVHDERKNEEYARRDAEEYML